MSNKYVFTELVTDTDNTRQLLAYALYKREKQQIAAEYEARGKSKDEIESALKHKHDLTVISPKALDGYRDQAETIMKQLIHTAKQPIQTEFDTYKQNDKLRVDKEAKKLQNQWLKKVELQRIDDQNTKIILYWNSFWTALTAGLRKYIIGLLITLAVGYLNLDNIKTYFSKSQTEHIKMEN